MKKTSTHLLAAFVLLLTGIQNLFAQQSNTYSSAAPVITEAIGTSPQTIKVNFVDTTTAQLCGVTYNGGSSGAGTIYKINEDGSNFTVLHNFDKTNDGGNGVGSLIQTPNGALFGVTFWGSPSYYGTIYKINPNGSDFTVIHNFNYDEGGTPSNGLILTSSNLLLGTTPAGGSLNHGLMYKITPQGDYSVIYNFTDAAPTGLLVEASDHLLYGMATGGGSEGYGTIFKIKDDGSGFAVLHNFNNSDGAFPEGALVQGLDGSLYGMTTRGGSSSMGNIFKINTDGSGYTVLHEFNKSNGGELPFNSLVQAPDGALYGMTFAGSASGYGFGTIFKINPDGSGYTIIHNFSNLDGSGPQSGLIIHNNKLLGYTAMGGLSGGGVVFSYDLVNSMFTKLADLNDFTGRFPLRGGLLVIQPSSIYYDNTPTIPSSDITFNNVLSTSMTVSCKPGNGSHRLVVMKAGSPPSFLPESNYMYSGNLGNGESVAYNGTDSLFNVSSLHANTEYFFKFFEFNTDSTATHYIIANAPVASKRTAQKRFLAVMGSGGTLGYGTIVSVNPDGSDFGVIHQFNLTNGASPKGSLIQAPDGWIYGVTSTGDDSKAGGTIFKIKADGTNHTVLHSFQYSEGIFPENSLTLTADGTLFGMTHIGGSSGYRGTIFKMNTNGTGFTVLQNFNVTNGADAYGKLTQLSDGTLVGMTQLGGSPGSGIIFKMNSDGSGFSILHNFNGSQGGYPVNSLIQGLDGSIMGMTYKGGASDVGTIFKMNVDGTGYTILHNCNTAEGSYPLGELVQSSDGTFWGTTRLGGSFNLGTIFKINADGSDYTVLHNFNGLDGASPQGGSMVIYNNKLFGLTALGGAFNVGVMFSYDMATSTYDKFRDLSFASGNKPYYGAPLLVDAPSLPPLERPTVAASNISFSNILSTSMTVTFNPGNGNGYLAILRPGGAPTFRPVDNTNYSGALGHSQMVVYNGPGHTFDIKDLESYRTYYVMIFEYISDGAGNIKYLLENAPVKSQRTRLLPEVYLTKPGNGAVNQMIQITLKAKPVEGATVYTYEVSPDVNFVNPKAVSGSSTLLIDSLQYNTLYYARVKTNLRADYGKVITFSTRTAESLAYVTSPANNAVNVPTKIAVASNKVPGASEYTIQLSETNDFSTVAFEAIGLSRILHFTGLKNNTTYYSRVRVNLSPSFGGTRSFTTVADASTARLASVSDFNPSGELMEFEVRVYPNPFREKLILYIESSTYDVATIKLTDINGRVVHESTEKTNTTIEVEKTFVSGIYLLHANSGTQSKWIRVVKIQ